MFRVFFSIFKHIILSKARNFRSINRSIPFLFLLLPLSAFAIKPLQATYVFQFEPKRLDEHHLMLQWTIKPGHFLYQARTKIIESPESKAFVKIMPIEWPETTIKTDKQGHHVTVYRNHLSIPLTLLGQHAGETTLQIQTQGCSDEGFCYPPLTYTLQLQFNADLALSDVSWIHLIPTPPNNSKTIQTLENHTWLYALGVFFILGLFLSFTPCILPMIPVLSSIIVGQKKSTQNAFFISGCYVLSMSLTYACVGIIMATMGKNLQVALQTPSAIIVLSLIFILLALSMFDFFQLKLPQSWQAKFAQMSYQKKHGPYLNATLMGILSTLILSPCVTAPLIGVLTYVADTGRAFFGFSALFALGLGMGFPLLCIGTSLNRIIPHTGLWMNQIKGLFGFMLFGLAIDTLSRIMPGLLVMIAWSTLSIACAFYLGLLKRSKTLLQVLRQTCAFILLIYGILILVGASQGRIDPLYPLRTQAVALAQQTVSSLPELTQALNQAKKDKKPVILDFYADWCRSCHHLETMLANDDAIHQALLNVTFIRVDVTAQTDSILAMQKMFHVIAPPTYLFLNAKGQEITAARLVGEFSSQTFLQKLVLLT